MGTTLFPVSVITNESPITFPAIHSLSGETYNILMDGNDLVDFLFKRLYSTEIIPLLPKIIFEIRDGHYWNCCQSAKWDTFSTEHFGIIRQH